jgi:hypothetical protein
MTFVSDEHLFLSFSRFFCFCPPAIVLINVCLFLSKRIFSHVLTHSLTDDEHVLVPVLSHEDAHTHQRAAKFMNAIR